LKSLYRIPGTPVASVLTGLPPKGGFHVKHLAPLAAVAALMWAALAHATLQYAISVDGGPSFVCVDNVGACDINPAVGVIQSVTAAYLPPAFKDAFVFGSYILIGLFRPQGLFGRF